MASLKQIIYYLGESKTALTSREIASKIVGKNDVDLETRRVYFLIHHYKQFISSEIVSPNPNVGKKYSLNANGRKFYDRLVTTYDPITNTQILPQNTFMR